MAIGLSQPELANRCGWQKMQGRISHYETGRRTPRMDDFLMLAKALDTPPTWLLTGEGPQHISTDRALHEKAEHPVTSPDGQEASPTDLVIIPHYTATISGDHSQAQQTSTPMAPHLSLSRSWLEEHGWRPALLSLMIMRGQAMSPILQDGDLLMIHHHIGPIVDGEIYLLELDGEPYIRRVQRIPGKQVLLSGERPEIRDYTLPLAKFSSVGRVVWVGSSVSL
ncbi:MAG: helix-turn-helix domain-containing protein [Magnetococcales bacterium]|nr:helix-turn-helix domain-containing protein [Magnetococcales bacterium]